MTRTVYDVICTCGFHSAAKYDRDEMVRLAAQHHHVKKHDATQTQTIRTIVLTFDDDGRITQPPQVTP